MQLHQLPHKQLTGPTKLVDFDLCGPAGTPYPREMLLQLEVLAAGQLNGLVVWFDLHLAEGVSLTSGGYLWGVVGCLIPSDTFGQERAGGGRGNSA